MSALRVPRLRPAHALLVAAALLLPALTVVLDLLTSPADRAAIDAGTGIGVGAFGAFLLLAAVVVLHHHPGHGVGRVLAASGCVWTVDGVAGAWMSFAPAHDLPLGGFAFYFVEQVGSVLLMTLPLVLLLYPTGSLLPGRWRIAGVAVIVAAAALPLLAIVSPADALGPVPVETGVWALPLSNATVESLFVVCRTLTLSSLGLALLLVLVRARLADADERHRLRWLVWAAATCVLLAVVGLVVEFGALSTTLLHLALVVTTASVVIGIVAPDVTDVDALMGGTVTFAVVAVLVVSLDVALIAGLDALLRTGGGAGLGDRSTTALLLLVAVTVYAPVRSWVASAVRRVLVGRRGDRYDVLSRLAARLETSDDVPEQLPVLAATVATAFKLRYVAVEVHGPGGAVLGATHGTPPAAVRRHPIVYRDEEIGSLTIEASGLRSMLSGRDQALLVDVVRQAAVAIRASRLADALQRSREGILLDREEDRRRIRRDLHDGLGPVLGGVAMRLDAADNALETDAATARTLIRASRTDITEALADVGRLVHGLRPPALDDLGLVAALDQQVAAHAHGPVEVQVDAAGIRELPAAVEVAAYRIASESLANVVRHADAHACTIRLAVHRGRLLVEIVDDGRGIAPDITAGVGLRSIRERAEELGGSTEISCPASGGTRVRAWLPLRDAPPVGLVSA